MSFQLDAMEMVNSLTMKDIIMEASTLLSYSEKRRRDNLIAAISESGELQEAV
jgi:hypothetical protein